MFNNVCSHVTCAVVSCREGRKRGLQSLSSSKSGQYWKTNSQDRNVSLERGEEMLSLDASNNLPVTIPFFPLSLFLSLTFSLAFTTKRITLASPCRFFPPALFYFILSICLIILMLSILFSFNLPVQCLATSTKVAFLRNIIQVTRLAGLLMPPRPLCLAALLVTPVFPVVCAMTPKIPRKMMMGRGTMLPAALTSHLAIRVVDNYAVSPKHPEEVAVKLLISFFFFFFSPCTNFHLAGIESCRWNLWYIFFL